jgi:hypothetical protein
MPPGRWRNGSGLPHGAALPDVAPDLFSKAGLLMAAIGIYGLIRYSTGARTRRSALARHR